jgi:hypothetical protein
MKDYSHLDKKTLFMHRTYLRDEGKLHEYFFGRLEATKSSVTAYTQVSRESIRCYVFEPWFIDRFKENTAKREFEIYTKKFVPNYTVRYTVDQRSKTSNQPSEHGGNAR